MWAWQTVLLIKGSYNLARIGWQFSLCVSRLTKCWHHLPHILSWVSLQGTSELTANKQTLSLGGGKGLNCMMQMTVADLSTMTKQWHPFCAADLTQVQRLQKGSLCCKCVPGHWRRPQHSYHTYLPTQRGFKHPVWTCNNVTCNENWEFLFYFFVTWEWV
jgi:hypothetical protein